MSALPNIVLVHGAWADGSSWSAIILGNLLGEGRCLRSGSWLRAASGADGRVPRRCGSRLAGKRPRLRQERKPEMRSGPRMNLRPGPLSVVPSGRRQPEMVLLLWSGLNKPVFEAGVEGEGVRAG
jgi:hypothetical protein